MKVTVLGAGAWGTALAHHLAQYHETVLWARDTQLAQQLAQHQQNTAYLPSIALCPDLRYAAGLQNGLHEALQHTAHGDHLCVAAVPVAGLRALCQAIQQSAYKPADFIWVCKGFEADTHALPHQIVASIFGASQDTGIRYGVLSGPSFAREIAQGLPAALTVASTSAQCCARTVEAFHKGAIRIYTEQDVIGVEVGGAVKNVLAIAAGLSDGLKLGLNARAALLTRGLAEMTRLGVALGAHAQTFMGLSGVGDLILTATGELSRNRKVGQKLGEGLSLEAILGSLGHVAEGVRCAQTVLALAQAHSLSMPITQAVCAVLFEGASPQTIVQGLLAREGKAERAGY
jgi:glycerol-3-phosphate dehydrogenase (NAD(P)+)